MADKSISEAFSLTFAAARMLQGKVELQKTHILFEQAFIVVRCAV